MSKTYRREKNLIDGNKKKEQKVKIRKDTKHVNIQQVMKYYRDEHV